MLARAANPRGILMLNLSMVKDMKWQTYKKRLVMVIFVEIRTRRNHSPYDLAGNKVNAIDIVFKIR